MTTISFLNVSSASALSDAIKDIDLFSQAYGGNGDNYLITLQAGATLIESADISAINLTGSDTLTIDGQGAILDGAGPYRGLFAFSGAATIENLTIENALAEGGAGAGGGGLPTISQGLCGAVTPRDSVALCLEGSVVLVPSTAPRRGAPLRCAPFGVTSTARGALPRGRSGRRDGRRGRTKGWDQGQAASATAARCGLKGVWVLSMAQATARRRSATLRKARPWL